MSFYNVIKKFKDFDFSSYINSVNEEDIEHTLNKDSIDAYGFLNLLSPAALKYLEPMAVKSRKITLQYFGRVISLYLPIYVSNFCTNQCVYCGFNVKNKIKRVILTHDEIEKEAKEIAKSGIKHILLLTGEAPEVTPRSYLKEAVAILKKYFSSIAIEIFPLDFEEYSELQSVGVDGLTIYQETYDEEIYKQVHLAGKKRNYRYRLDTPERGAKAGFRSINIGALFGLGPIVKEAFLSALHAKYLEDNYLDAEISLSIPRMNNAEGSYKPKEILDDKRFLQILLAYRIFLPRVGINISTRERAEFRDKLIGLGVTKFSAGSKTRVGGYAVNNDNKSQFVPQFEISDNRSVSEVVEAIKKNGYQPIYKDWEMLVWK